MALNIDVSIHEDAIDDGVIEVHKEFAFVGFNIVNERTKDINGVEFYFYLEEAEEKVYMIKTMFAFEQESQETDLIFLNSPLHNSINLNKIASENPEKITEILLDIAEDRQYYCSFKAIEVSDDDKVTCTAVHTDEDGKQHKVNFIMPFTTFCRVQMIKNQMLYNIPINVFIDQDDAFDNIKFHKNCDLKYMGCDTSYKTQVLAFYSMKDDNDVSLGLISPVHALYKIVVSNILEKEKFSELYKDKSAVVNMTKIFIMDWIDEGNSVKKVCVYFRDKKEVNVYMINGNAKDCILMKPYDMVYKMN